MYGHNEISWSVLLDFFLLQCHYQILFRILIQQALKVFKKLGLKLFKANTRVIIKPENIFSI